MAINPTAGPSSGSPIDLYKIDQSRYPSRGASKAQPSSQNETAYSVEISKKALEMQKRDDAKQAEAKQSLQEDRDVRRQADKDIDQQREASREYGQQQSIDVIA